MVSFGLMLGIWDENDMHVGGFTSRHRSSSSMP